MRSDVPSGDHAGAPPTARSVLSRVSVTLVCAWIHDRRCWSRIASWPRSSKREGDPVSHPGDQAGVRTRRRSSSVSCVAPAAIRVHQVQVVVPLAPSRSAKTILDPSGDQSGSLSAVSLGIGGEYLARRTPPGSMSAICPLQLEGDRPRGCPRPQGTIGDHLLRSGAGRPLQSFSNVSASFVPRPPCRWPGRGFPLGAIRGSSLSRGENTTRFGFSSRRRARPRSRSCPASERIANTSVPTTCKAHVDPAG